VQHLDPTSEVDGVVTKPLVKASDERDLSTDGGWH
jgi:hypothetical protein